MANEIRPTILLMARATGQRVPITLMANTVWPICHFEDLDVGKTCGLEVSFDDRADCLEVSSLEFSALEEAQAISSSQLTSPLLARDVSISRNCLA